MLTLLCSERALNDPRSLLSFVQQLITASRIESVLTMTLQEELQTFAEQMSGKIPVEVRATMVEATQQLADSGLVENALKVGDKAPLFDLENETGKKVALADLLADGPVVLVFYRGGWCPYCNLELRAYQRELDAIKAAGATLVAISPEKPDNSLTAVEKNELAFNVLSDTGLGVAAAYGLAFDLPDKLIPIYENFGIDLPNGNADTGWRLPIPGTYVIDTDGTIQLAHADVDYTKRLEPAAVTSLLTELKAKAA